MGVGGWGRRELGIGSWGLGKKGVRNWELGVGEEEIEKLDNYQLSTLFPPPPHPPIPPPSSSLGTLHSFPPPSLGEDSLN
uniref:Uncharacterized protein n=1 Tax=Desertifilum tharense IPPAS B-1220 TaxID=1781255 RepID=A0ACD5GUM9_9CYAN